MILLAAGLPVLAATAAVLLRAALRSQDRGAWLALGRRAAREATGAIWLAMPGGGPRFPTPRRRRAARLLPRRLRRRAAVRPRAAARASAPALWLDAAIGAVGAAAIVTQLLGGTVARATGGGWPAAVALAYPMGDVLLVVMVVVAVTLRGWRVSPVWLLLAAGLLAHVIADVGYVSSGLADERRALWVPVLGLLSPLLIAAARLEPGARAAPGRARGLAHARDADAARARRRRPARADHFHQTIDAAVFLSAATLVSVLVRMALTFVENTALHATRELALTDELTGLANRRLFHERLAAELAEGDATLAVAMVDLDRFKELNDTLGHHAGDRLLAQLGPAPAGGGRRAPGWSPGSAATSSRCCCPAPGWRARRTSGAGSASRSSSRSRSKGSRS